MMNWQEVIYILYENICCIKPLVKYKTLSASYWLWWPQAIR